MATRLTSSVNIITAGLPTLQYLPLPRANPAIQLIDRWLSLAASISTVPIEEASIKEWMELLRSKYVGQAPFSDGLPPGMVPAVQFHWAGVPANIGLLVARSTYMGTFIRQARDT
jgi:hypothetical protein